LREKTGKNTDFLILLKKTDFLDAHFVTSWYIKLINNLLGLGIWQNIKLRRMSK
jgi:hypothetical protein